MHARACSINNITQRFALTRELCILPVFLSISVGKNQIDLYDALAGTRSPVIKPNELVGVRVVESEGPLKGQLELKFEHDLPYGTSTFTHICMHACMRTHARAHAHARARAHTHRYCHTFTGL